MCSSNLAYVVVALGLVVRARRGDVKNNAARELPAVALFMGLASLICIGGAAARLAHLCRRRG